MRNAHVFLKIWGKYSRREAAIDDDDDDTPPQGRYTNVCFIKSYVSFLHRSPLQFLGLHAQAKNL